MTKTIAAILILLLLRTEGYSQQGVMILKKRNKSIRYFWKGSPITFQLKDKQWIAGTITKITPDSFYFTRYIVRYSMTGVDTLHLGGLGFSFQDVYALPTKKEMVSWNADNPHIILGHEKFVWVRNGFIFQVAGAGYTALSIGNDLINHSPPFSKKKRGKLYAAAGLFLFGEILHLKFDTYLHTGKKYHLEYMAFTDEKPGLKSF